MSIERTNRLVTRPKRISSVAVKTTAGRLMIINLALRVNAARTYARILALVVDASLRVRAIRVLNAFRSATLVRIAGVIGQTGAGTCAVTLFAYGVRAARRRIARQLRWESSCEIKIHHSAHIGTTMLFR